MITVYMTTAEFTMLVRNNIKTLFSITFGRNIYLYQDHDALVSNTQMAIRSTYKILTELEEKFEDL